MNISPYPINISRPLFLFFLLITAGRVAAQEFAPLGTIWTYENLFSPNPESVIAIQYAAVRDTIIDKRPCRIIEGASLYSNDRRELLGQEVVCGNADSVDVFIDGVFYKIFDFTAAAGDTIRVISTPFQGFFSLVGLGVDSLVYRIDSIETKLIEGDSLLLQSVSYLTDPTEIDFNYSQWGFQNGVDYWEGIPGQILQGVGSLGRESMLGTSIDISYIGGFFPDRLGCYQDSLRSINLTGVDCVALVEGASGLSGYSPFAGMVYPNPFTNLLRIEYPEGSQTEKIVLRDLMGRVVQQWAGSPETLKLGELSSGAYLLSMVNGSGQQFYTRVMKW